MRQNLLLKLNGNTKLHFAVQLGHMAVVTAFLEHKVIDLAKVGLGPSTNFEIEGVNVLHDGTHLQVQSTKFHTLTL